MEKVKEWKLNRSNWKIGGNARIRACGEHYTHEPCYCGNSQSMTTMEAMAARAARKPTIDITAITEKNAKIKALIQGW